MRIKRYHQIRENLPHSAHALIRHARTNIKRHAAIARLNAAPHLLHRVVRIHQAHHSSCTHATLRAIGAGRPAANQLPKCQARHLAIQVPKRRLQRTNRAHVSLGIGAFHKAGKNFARVQKRLANNVRRQHIRQILLGILQRFKTGIITGKRHALANARAPRVIHDLNQKRLALLARLSANFRRTCKRHRNMVQLHFRHFQTLAAASLKQRFIHASRTRARKRIQRKNVPRNTVSR